MDKRPLKRYFAQFHYADAEAVMRHAFELSEQIKAGQSSVVVKPRKPLSRFSQEIVAMAPKFLKGQYDQKAMALEILARSGEEPAKLRCVKLGEN